MFVTLPKIFASMGAAGRLFSFAFFTLVLFAALTSSISMTEACVASVCDFFKVRRGASVVSVGAWTVAVGAVSAFGYGRWASFRPLGTPALEFFDNSMNVLTPIVAACTCVFAGWILGPKTMLGECTEGGAPFRFRGFFVFMIRFAAPALVLLILASELCRMAGVWSI